MLRSEPRLTSDVLDELHRLDAALAADRRGARPDATGGRNAPAGATDRRDAPTDSTDRRDAPVHRGEAPADPATAHDPTTDSRSTPADDLDRELLALVADVRAGRPELDAGARMRLDERVRAAKQAPAPRTAPRIAADRRWRTGLALAAVAAVAIPVGVVLRDGATGGSGATVSSLAQGERTTDSGSAAAGGSTGTAGELESAAPPAGDVAAPSSTARRTLPSPGSSGTVPASPPLPPTTKQAPLDATRRVIRDVEQTVRIAPGEVARSADRVTSVVQGAGGYLGSSEIRERGPRAGATFEVVVPTGRLDETVAALSRIGTPVRLERSSTDVTDRAVTLDDQLGDLRADRSAARLALARTVDDDRRAARRRELDLLSSRIAALQGQRDELRRQTSTSRIDLRLTTTGAAEDDPPPTADDGSWGIGDAWDDAGRVLEVGGGVLLLGGVVVAPFAALLALGVGLRRRTAARRRDTAIDEA